MKIFLKIVFISLLFINKALIIPSYGQSFISSNSGASFGLSYAFGSTLNRIGLSASAYYTYDFIQLNLSLKGFYNFSTFGPGLPGWESQFATGAVLGIGPKKEETNPFITPVSNQMGRKYSFGYAYNYYMDKMQTSQPGGTIGIEINRFQIITENDILAGKGGDQFRTGGLFFSYRYKENLVGLNATMWTGNANKDSKKFKESSFSRFGYKDLSESPNGKFSHGILSLQLQQLMPYGQISQYNVGFDSEHVRNILQNRLMHDMYFFPKKWNKAENPHVPMLDEEGNPYLYKENQKIKSASFYINYSMNNSLFY